MENGGKLDRILSEIHDMKDDMRVMKSDMQDMKDDMQDMKGEMQVMKADIHGMKDNIQELNQKVKKIDLVLENEIRVNIQRVAEGHFDLSRNLHEAMKPSNEIEMLSIKVRRLETDVRELKDKIS